MQNPLARYRLDDDRPNQETGIERLMREAFTLTGIAYQEQGRVGRYRPDFIVHISGRRIVVECDGPVHETRRQRLKDRRKDAAYAAAGLPVRRFTYQDIRKSAIGCAQALIREFHHDPAAHPLHDADSSVQSAND